MWRPKPLVVFFVSAIKPELCSSVLFMEADEISIKLLKPKLLLVQ